MTEPITLKPVVLRTIELLEHAHTVLSKEGAWTQGALAEGSEKDQVLTYHLGAQPGWDDRDTGRPAQPTCLCLVGGIADGAIHLKDSSVLERKVAFHGAHALLSLWVHTPGQALTLERWNDTAGRKKEEVLHALRQVKNALETGNVAMTHDAKREVVRVVLKPGTFGNPYEVGWDYFY